MISIIDEKKNHKTRQWLIYYDTPSRMGPKKSDE